MFTASQTSRDKNRTILADMALRNTTRGTASKDLRDESKAADHLAAHERVVPHVEISQRKSAREIFLP